MKILNILPQKSCVNSFKTRTVSKEDRVKMSEMCQNKELFLIPKEIKQPQVSVFPLTQVHCPLATGIICSTKLSHSALKHQIQSPFRGKVVKKSL